MNRNTDLESKKKKLQNRMEGKIWEKLGKIIYSMKIYYQLKKIKETGKKTREARKNKSIKCNPLVSCLHDSL